MFKEILLRVRVFDPALADRVILVNVGIFMQLDIPMEAYPVTLLRVTMMPLSLNMIARVINSGLNNSAHLMVTPLVE